MSYLTIKMCLLVMMNNLSYPASFLILTFWAWFSCKMGTTAMLCDKGSRASNPTKSWPTG